MGYFKRQQIREDLSKVAADIGRLLMEFQRKHGPVPVISIEVETVDGQHFRQLKNVHAVIDRR